MPTDVMATLRRDDYVSRILESEGILPDNLPEAWFSASAIHLTSATTPDLIIMATGRLAGSNVRTFWLFRSTANAFDLVLTAPAHDVYVKTTRSKGYRDIEMLAASATHFYSVYFKFDGNHYVATKRKDEPLP